jgi:hypothetical protein
LLGRKLLLIGTILLYLIGFFMAALLRDFFCDISCDIMKKGT